MEFQSAPGYVQRRAANHDYPILPTCVPRDYHGECQANLIRKMQCSFSWDWGPSFPTQGIWYSIFSNHPVFIYLLWHNPDICQFWQRRLLKTLWEKEKMLVTSIFSFSYNVFFPIKESLHHLNHNERQQMLNNLNKANILLSDKGSEWLPLGKNLQQTTFKGATVKPVY